MKNIFIEGIQGAGKSTLFQEIQKRRPQYHVCREGDYSPIELAWCTWMTKQEYEKVKEQFPTLEKEICENTTKEGEKYIVTYTRILTDEPGFHKTLEEYEIYQGRKSLKEFEEIIISRYQKFRESGYLFECSFFQNIVEDLILYYQLSDDEIIAFYKRLYEMIKQEDFLMLYLYSEDVAENIRVIKKERCDGQGNEMWYPLMMNYLKESPYGKVHGYQDFKDMVKHFEHRQNVEMRIIKEVIKDKAIVLPSKRWVKEDLLTGICSER